MRRALNYQSPSIDPGFTIILFVIGWLVITVLVEIDVAVVFLHIDLKLLRRPTAFPAIVGIAHAVVAFRNRDGWHKPFAIDTGVPYPSCSEPQKKNAKLKSKVGKQEICGLNCGNEDDEVL